MQDIFYYPDLILQPRNWHGAGCISSDLWKTAARGNGLSPPAQPVPLVQTKAAPNRPGESTCAWGPQRLGLLLSARSSGRCFKKAIIKRNLNQTRRRYDKIKFICGSNYKSAYFAAAEDKIPGWSTLHDLKTCLSPPQTSYSSPSWWGARSFYHGGGTWRLRSSNWRLLQWGRCRELAPQSLADVQPSPPQI